MNKLFTFPIQLFPCHQSSLLTCPIICLNSLNHAKKRMVNQVYHILIHSKAFLVCFNVKSILSKREGSGLWSLKNRKEAEYNRIQSGFEFEWRVLCPFSILVTQIQLCEIGPCPQSLPGHDKGRSWPEIEQSNLINGDHQPCRMETGFYWDIYFSVTITILCSLKDQTSSPWFVKIELFNIHYQLNSVQTQSKNLNN